MHQKEQLEPMRFGDLITLQGTVKTPSDSDSGDNAIGFLSADPCFSRVGFQQVCPSYSYSSFEQCIFQLCPMLSYDNKASKSKLERRGSFSEEEAMLMDMRIKMEEGKNARQMKGMLVSPELVMYGMSVQLMHLATGMYLTGESFTATEEKDCLRLTLSPGTLTSSFKIMPRFKVRHEGSEIYYRDQLLIFNQKMMAYGLHASNKTYDPLQPLPTFSEMNLSVNPSSLKVEKFARFSSSERAHKLFACLDLVRFSHPETDSFLSCSCNLQKKTKPPYMRLNTDETNYDVSVKSMWVIEHLDYTSSSAIEWGVEVRIRHAITNMYLSVNSQPSLAGAPRRRASSVGEGMAVSGTPVNVYQEKIYDCEMVDSSDLSPSSIFRLVPTDSQGEEIPKHHVSFRLEHNDAVTGATLYITSATKTKYEGHPIYQQKSLDMKFSNHKGDNDAFLLMPFEVKHVVKKVDELRALTPYLSWFTESRVQRISSVQDLRLEDIKKCERVVKGVITSIIDSKDGDDDGHEDDHKSDPECSEVSQTFARDLKVMDMVFIIATLPATFKLDTSYDQQSLAWLDHDFNRVANLVSLCWRALQTMFFNNRESENYFARKEGWIFKTISLISDPIGAAVAFSKLISNNATLVEEYVSHDTIEEFKTLIMAKGFQSRLLEFFVSICTCNGKAIISNQEAVLSQVWLKPQDREQVLFAIKTDDDMTKATQWQSLDNSYPDDFLGKECVASGFKRVLVDWSKVTQLSDFFVNGKQSCSVEELCWVLEPQELCERVTGKSWDEHTKAFQQVVDENGAARMSEANISFNRQWDLAKYFERQLYLFASMCRGRSYGSIFELSKTISYTMVCSMMASESLPASIRAASIKVLHTMYIDRYPHSPNCGRPSLPDLVWNSENLKKTRLAGEYAKVEGALPCFRLSPDHELKQNPDPFYSIDSHSKFFLVRDFIHTFTSLSGGLQEYSKAHEEKNKLTCAIVTILADLMSFGFFSTKEKIEIVCLPMNKTLDGRTDHVVLGGGPSSSKMVVAASKKKNSERRISQEVKPSLKTTRKKSNKVQPVNGGEGGGAGGEHEKALVSDLMRQLQKRKNIDTYRYALEPRSQSAHQSKVYILETLFKIADMRAHYRCSQLLYELKDRASAKVSVLTQEGVVSTQFIEVFNRLFEDEDGTALDVNKMMDAPIDSVCIDLMMYESDEVFEHALGFIRRRYGQRRSLLSSLKEVTVLKNDSLPVFGNFGKLDACLKDLTFYIRSYDTWGVYKGAERPMVRETYDEVISIFDRLDAFLFDAPDLQGKLYDASSLPSLCCDKHPPSEFHQRILRNMGLVRSVLIWGLEMNYALMSKIQPDYGGLGGGEREKLLEQSEGMLFNVCKRVVFTLNAFVEKNADNQAILFGNLTLLRSKMGVGLNVWDIVITVLEGNQALCETAPRALFMEFSKIMSKSVELGFGFDVKTLRLLDFFFVLTKPTELRPIARSQDLVTLFLFDPTLSSNLVLEVDLKNEENTYKVLYHIKLIKLLALTALEKNSVSTARIQGVISLDFALSKVDKDGGDGGDLDLLAQAAFLDLLANVYIDTALLERGICGRMGLWKALDHIARTARKVEGRLTKDMARPEDEKENVDLDLYPIIYFTSALNLLVKFYKCCYVPSSMGEELSDLHETVMEDVGELIKLASTKIDDLPLAVVGLLDELKKQVGYKEVEVQAARKTSIRIGDPSSVVSIVSSDLSMKVEKDDGGIHRAFMSSRLEASITSRFEAMDTDGNGFLSYKEVRTTMLREAHGLNDKDVTALFSKYDKDKDSGINKKEFMNMMSDAQSMTPGSGVEWLNAQEVLDHSPETMKLMAENLDQFLHVKLYPAIKRSETISKALAQKDDEFLDILENSAEITNPDDPEYIAALRGTTLEEEKRLMSAQAAARLDPRTVFATKVLNTMNGTAALFLVLFVVFLAIILLIVQFVSGSNETLAAMDTVITIFFVIELVVKASSHAYVHREIDSFLLDFLNFIDVLVVFVDLLFIYVASKSDSTSNGGVIKALRLARAARLLRLFRIRRLLAVPKKHMDREEASKDPRAVSITFEMLVERMVEYLRNNSLELGASKQKTLAIVMNVLNLHLERKVQCMSKARVNEAALVADVSYNEMLKIQTEEYQGVQNHIGIDCGCVEVLLKCISKCDDGAIRRGGMNTLRKLLEGGNKEIQSKCIEILTEIGGEAIGPSFFFACRELLREALDGLKEYRKVRKTNFERSATLSQGVVDSGSLFDLMKEMVEGHNVTFQHLLRKQPHSKSANLVEEIVEIWTVLSKSLSCIRKWDNAEGALALNCIDLLIELCQGPCRENQEVFVRNGKAIDGCVCVITANMSDMDDTTLRTRLCSAATCLLAAVLEDAEKGYIQSVKDLMPGGILDDRAKKVAGRLQWLKSMSKSFQKDFFEVLNNEAQAILTLKHSFESVEEEEEEEEGGVGGGGEEEEEEEGAKEGREGKGGGIAGLQLGQLGQPKVAKLALRSVEIFWHGRCQKTFFTPFLDSLSDATKNRFMEECALDSQETRIKEMIKACDDLSDEMVYQNDLSQFVVFQFISVHFLTIKRFVFAMVLLLNINVMLSTLQDETLVLADEAFGFNSSQNLTVLLGLLVMFCYSFIVAYLIVSFGPLEWRRCLRNQVVQDAEVEALKARGEDPPKSNAMRVYCVMIIFYICCCYIHSMTANPYSAEKYQNFGETVFAVLLPLAIRLQLQLPKSPILRRYCAALDALSYPTIRNHLILVVFTWIGLWRSYFFTLTLLDVLTMSPTLAGVVKSVVMPISQLMQTFALFIIVICCYTSFAYFLFGSGQFGGEDDRMIEYFVNVSDVNGTEVEELQPTGLVWLPEEEEGAVEGCDTLLECFTQTVYLGIRAGDIAEILDDPDENNYTTRMLFDLSFFLILGILLFDMVTGIILDTFGSLREEVAERNSILASESFVSGLERKEIEEIGEGLNFDSINEADQSLWDYIFYVIYIRDKDASNMTGSESFVNRCLEEGDTSWIPNHTSLALETVQGGDGGEEEEELGEKVEKLESGIRRLEEKFDMSFAQILEKLK
ncbi:hypothetical protein TrLO_g6616 [Triparma laevis f. longispina]|uniref:EF-hand domain-containing protein n=1 Tax=Triparma laevis f. longispina TaxID=1714387 RepID=A0A9W7DWA0_9STRA|nr:hypothetical protein TrLO_g6616 [Triparma laevis f. longispina]